MDLEKETIKTEQELNKSGGDFVHLHVHDEYSLLDGINRVDRIPSYIQSIGGTALAQTNHGSLNLL